MKDKYELEKIVAARNSILLICMTVLFIVFKSWWPALLLLLWSYIDREDKVNK